MLKNSIPNIRLSFSSADKTVYELNRKINLVADLIGLQNFHYSDKKKNKRNLAVFHISITKSNWRFEAGHLFEIKSGDSLSQGIFFPSSCATQ